ncbi:hypothetical protein ACFQZ4_13275 [Catellatospora coxensis]
MPTKPAVAKPRELFDRVHEWDALSGFVSQKRPGAALGLVYGRRRQGKTFLLSQLARATGGFMFTAAQQAAEQNLTDLSAAYHQFTGGTPLSSPAGPTRSTPCCAWASVARPRWCSTSSRTCSTASTASLRTCRSPWSRTTAAAAVRPA